jgi:DNA-binding IscR family transcriptional regulator
VGEIIRRLEGRLAVREAGPAETAPGKVAVRLLNDKLTSATEAVLNEMTLEELLEHVSRATSRTEGMYYI